MLQDDQLAHPWGTVTPDFWADPATEPGPGTAEDADWDEDLLYEEPAAVAAARADAPQRRVPAASSAPAPAGEATLEARFQTLTAALTTQRTDVELLLAASEAAQLDQEATDTLGPSAPSLASIRELRGLIARLQGDRAAAARWHLHVVGLHAALGGTADLRTKASARHAITDWRQIADPEQRAAVGREILPMLKAVAGPHAKPTREVQNYLG
ncbi:hypothetical protein P3T27_007968 [Kitasatospora sp. MAA19]|uniref:hypothetical protein n=1 Tax=unclassified Kitasatospora TaxID=2633591 RepID=UPI002476E90D|nr:hypothetical protein [Kitasatospora sp. MAA19]MDH6711215.1 hypothetical protein [Kitasatospora sp. MAA19]